MIDSYNKRTKDGTVLTEAPENILSPGSIERELSSAISSLEKANELLRRAKTSENSNKVNAAINDNEEQIKTMRSLTSKKKN